MKSIKKYGLIFISMLMITHFCIASQSEIVEKSFKVKSGGTLILDTDIGSIEINTESNDEVFVQIQYKLKSLSLKNIESVMDKYDLTFNKTNNDVQIINKLRDSGKWKKRPKHFSVKFIVSVPKKYHLKLKTSGGSISVTDLDGRINAKTSGGSLKFGQINGEIHAKTSGGSIKVAQCDASVDVHTSGGNINIGNVNGDVSAYTSGGSVALGEIEGSIEAKTSGGNIRVDNCKNTIYAATSGGSVTASLSEQPDGECKLKTSGGNVNVTLAEHISMNLDASTSGGSIRTDFPIKVQGKLSKKHIEAEINDGGPLLYLRTSGGSVYINKM